MTKLRALAVALPLSSLLAGHARAAGQTEPRHDEPSYSLSASVYAYFVPERSDYLQPTVAFDRHALHLEARYSYEDLLTGSAWAGVNLLGGETVGWELTPMFGVVFGRTNGVAPGFKGALTWWKLELYAEGEYVFDFGDVAESFFFEWSELTLAPVDWFRFGILTQRTRIYSSGRLVERGLLVGFSYRAATLTGYLLNPDDSKPIGIVALGLTFDR